MSVFGKWKLILFEHWIKEELLVNKLVFSKRLNQFQSNYQTLILNHDFTFSLQCYNKNVNLKSQSQGNFSLIKNQLNLIHYDSSNEQFELLFVNRRILRLEQKFCILNSKRCLKNCECQFYRFGFVKT